MVIFYVFLRVNFLFGSFWKESYWRPRIVFLFGDRVCFPKGWPEGLSSYSEAEGLSSKPEVLLRSSSSFPKRKEIPALMKRLLRLRVLLLLRK